MRRKSYIRREILELPLFLLIFGVFSASTIFPAIFALTTQDHLASRAFFYSGLLGVIIFTLIAVAQSRTARAARGLGAVDVAVFKLCLLARTAGDPVS